MTDLSDPRYLPSAARRRLLGAALLGGAAVAAPAFARAQEAAQEAAPPTLGPTVPAPPQPIVDARFPHEVAPGVFILPDRRIPLVPNVGIVVGTEAALVVDCGLGLESAEAVLALARALAPGRALILTVTHAHPEHGFGAQVFRNEARIFYNRAQADHLARSGRTLLDGFREGVMPDGQEGILDGIVLVPPDETYAGARASSDLGGRQVELMTWGTAHSPGDQVVRLPAEGIVFAGDLIEERMFPIVPFFPPMIGAGDIDAARWEQVLADIVALEPRLIVPGHGNLGGPEVALEVGGYLREVRALVTAAGGPGDGLETRIRDLHPTWENSQFIAPATRYFAQARP